MAVGTDNRVFERIEGELGVRYSPQGSDREFCTTSKNISGGGIRISLLKKMDPGTILDLEIFRYNAEARTRCRGKVAWIWEEAADTGKEQIFEAGIQFLDSQLLYLGRLMDYLEKQNKNVTLS
ncbi:MAG: PilZ domain-containing protein [Candidatus Omnitrophica bacterium]|nr:PilZ domain-containing protein [Candidatus Omnitrophota bacterium]